MAWWPIVPLWSAAVHVDQTLDDCGAFVKTPARNQTINQFVFALLSRPHFHFYCRFCSHLSVACLVPPICNDYVASFSIASHLALQVVFWPSCEPASRAGASHTPLSRASPGTLTAARDAAPPTAHGNGSPSWHSMLCLASTFIFNKVIVILIV